MIREKISKWSAVISDIVFPPVCACCGHLTIHRSDAICKQCLQTRFEPDRDDESIILPESVLFRVSLWKFDKLGYLQDLLHKLKYDHLTGVGICLGKEVGGILLRNEYLHQYFSSPEELILVPVPLHKKRYRQRGYNQSRLIAEGISRQTGIELIVEGAVIRQKNTTTQTGLNSDERIKNLSNAFRLVRPDTLENKSPLIVDDVYTTGATTFELAAALYDNTASRSAIITIART